MHIHLLKNERNFDMDIEASQSIVLEIGSVEKKSLAKTPTSKRFFFHYSMHSINKMM